METRKSSAKLIIVLCTIVCIGLIAFITLRFIIPISDGTIAQPTNYRTYSKADVDETILSFLNDTKERYAYTQLSEAEQKAYDGIKWGVLSFADGIDLKQFKLSEEELKKAFSALRNDYPEIFWTYNNCNVYSMGSYITYCEPYYVYNKDDASIMINSIVSVKDALIARTNTMSDYEKCMFFFDYIIDYTDYDKDSYENYKSSTEDAKLELSCGIYGTLLSRKALCEGYAKTYKYLLDAAGIECIYVTGTALGEGHAWDIVKLDNAYYAVDVTWCDPQMSEGSKSYAYCMITDETLMVNHEIKMEYDVPACSGTKYNYYARNGYELYAYDIACLQDMFFRAYLTGNGFVEFHCANEAVMESFKQAVDSGEIFKAFEKIEASTGSKYKSFNYGLMEDVGSVRVDLK